MPERHKFPFVKNALKVSRAHGAFSGRRQHFIILLSPSLFVVPVFSCAHYTLHMKHTHSCHHPICYTNTYGNVNIYIYIVYIYMYICGANIFRTSLSQSAPPATTAGKRVSVVVYSRVSR